MTTGEALEGVTEEVLVATQGRLRRSGPGPPRGAAGADGASLRSLRTEAIGLYDLHRVDADTPLEESLGAIQAYVDRGAIRHVGVSEVSVEQIEPRPGGGADRRRAEPLQPRRPAARRRRGPLRARGDRVRAVLPAARRRRRGRGRRRRAPRGDRERGQARLAAAALARRAPHPGTLSIEHLRENLEALELELDADEIAA